MEASVQSQVESKWRLKAIWEPFGGILEPKLAQETSRGVLRVCKLSLRGAQEAPSCAKEAPKRLHLAPKRLQVEAKRRPRVAKCGPKAALEVPS